MKKTLFYCLIMAVSLSGCFWPFSGVRRTPPPCATGDGISFEILDEAAMSKGGKVYMMPFAAGIDASAGDVLDRYALLMVKGLSDHLTDVKHFALVSGDEASLADFVMAGHIEQFKEIGHFKKKALIRIRGDLRSAATNHVAALIYVQREVVNHADSVDKEFYNIGAAIAAKFSQ